MKTNRITLITLGVADIDRARAFYEGIGWEPETVMDLVVFYNMNGMKFGFFTLEGLAKEQQRPIKELSTGAMTLAQTYPSEADVDVAFDRAIKAGATKVAEPFKTDWGGYSCYIADPDGHVWEYAHNPFWELDKDGHLK